MANPTDKMAGAMARYGIELQTNADGSVNLRETMLNVREALEDVDQTERAAAISAIFGKNAMSGWSAIVTASEEDFNSLADSIDNSQGAAERMAETKLDNLSGQVTLLKSALEGAAISIGTALTPMVTKLVEIVQGAVDWFNGLSESQQQLIVKIGVVVAAIGPFLLVLGKIITAVGTAMVWFAKIKTVIGLVAAVFGVASSTVLIVVGAFAALVAAGILVYKNWDKIKKKAKEVAKGIGDYFKKAKAELVAEFTRMKDGAQKAWDGIKSLVSSAISSVKSKFNTLKSAGDVVKKVFSDILSNVKEKINAAKEAVSSAINKIKGFFKSIPTMKIKVPHISVTGGKAPWGIGGKGSKPNVSVKYYKEAMDEAKVFTQPTMIGQSVVGDVGTEYVSGEKGIKKIVNDVIDQKNGHLEKSVDQMVRLLSVIAENSNASINIDGREFGRLVRKHA